MDTTSISKGVFLFKNGFKPQKRSTKVKKDPKTNYSFQDKLWYQSYKNLSNNVELEVQKLNSNIFLNVLHNLLECIKQCYIEPVNEIPTLALLTGINTDDNMEQFSLLGKEVKNNITSHVALLAAQDCCSIKALIENMVSQFVNRDYDSDYDDDDEEEDVVKKKIRKNLCTMTYLESWYKETNIQSPKKNDSTQKLLIVIFPEFESFQETVIQDFILITSSCLNKLPIVLIFGVATSLSVLHKTFSYQISSKLFTHTFNSIASTDHLNRILDNVILSNNNPFYLGGKAFSLFMDIFLFYDFSVMGFIQNYKFAMLQHFSVSEAMILCTDIERSLKLVKSLPASVLDEVRQLGSFRPYVESQTPRVRIKLLTDDVFFRQELAYHIIKFHIYLGNFHTLLRCLNILIEDLPRAPVGKQFRELYAIAISRKLTETSEYQETVSMLKFISKEELTVKISKICDKLRQHCENNEDSVLNSILEKFIKYSITINETDFKYDASNQQDMQIVDKFNEKVSREMLKQTLLIMAKQEKKQNNYEKFRELFLIELTDILDRYVNVPSSKPFHEIFVFNNISMVKNHIVGSHRAAIHTALNNPQAYLQCNCCHLANDLALLPVLPDICTVYKLHLECGKLINMYDWLQAFVAIVDPLGQQRENDKSVDLKLQARFTRAVAELEFLGFVKTSKRKTDHVMRLTWGG